MNIKEKKEFDKKRQVVIKELEKVEKKYGCDLFRSAVSRKIMVDRQTAQRQTQIKKMERELEQLKTGKPLPQY